MLSRRAFLSGLGLASVSGTLAKRKTSAEVVDVYKDLEVRPFINAAGTYTRGKSEEERKSQHRPIESPS